MRAHRCRFLLAFTAALAAAGAPIVAAACIASEICPMMAAEARHDCHEQEPQDLSSECCEATAGVAKEPLSRLPDFVNATSRLQCAVVPVVSSAPPRGADGAADRLGPSRAGPALPALLCTLLL